MPSLLIQAQRNRVLESAGPNEDEFLDALRDMARDLFCPVSQQILADPHVAPDGFVYELEFLKRWHDFHGTSPVTREHMSEEFVKCPRVLSMVTRVVDTPGVLTSGERADWHRRRAQLLMKGGRQSDDAEVQQHIDSCANLGGAGP